MALSWIPFCAWAKIRTSCFFLFVKHELEQFVMPSMEKLKADRHTADVERGFSAQSLICTSHRGNFLCFWRLQLLLLFDLYFSNIFGSHSRKHFFPFHDNFAELLGVFFLSSFCTVYVTEHRWDTALELILGMTNELVQPWNWRKKNTCTATWDWTAFQTASAAQKWAEMEVKWDNNFGH